MQLNPALSQSGWINLFDGDDLGVAFRDNGSGEDLIITFDQLSGFGHRRQKIGGEEQFLEFGYDHMHFSSAHQAWYQSPEILEALGVAGNLSQRYRKVVLYGSSQGGYASLMFSGRLHATRVLALAPQISVDPVRAPFENRFDGFVKDITFVFDDMAQEVSRTARKFLVYDPYQALDRAHVELLRDFPGIEEIRLPFAGHYPAMFLREAGSLKAAMRHLVLDDDPLPGIRKQRRAGRQNSNRYMLELASAQGRRGRFRQAISAINSAYLLQPDSIGAIEGYFAVLQGDGIWTGMAHALVRLILHEHPEWTHYEPAKNALWKQLKAIEGLKRS